MSIFPVLHCNEVNQTITIRVCRLCQFDLLDFLIREAQRLSQVCDDLIELLLAVDPLKKHGHSSCAY